MSDNMILDGQGPGEATKTTNGKSRKMRAGFATLAVLGLGAGLTTAMWTDNVNFTGQVRATSFNLVGAVNGSSTTPPHGQFSAAPVFDVTVPGNQPGDAKTVYLWVQDQHHPHTANLTTVEAVITAESLPANVNVGAVGGFVQHGYYWAAPLTFTGVSSEAPGVLTGGEGQITIEVTGTGPGH